MSEHRVRAGIGPTVWVVGRAERCGKWSGEEVVVEGGSTPPGILDQDGMLG